MTGFRRAHSMCWKRYPCRDCRHCRTFRAPAASYFRISASATQHEYFGPCSRCRSEQCGSKIVHNAPPSRILALPMLRITSLGHSVPARSLHRRAKEMTTGADMKTTEEKRCSERAFVQSVHGVRYQVKDVARAVAFYTTHLGFTLTHQQLPAFASVSLGDVQILLSGPQASGSRPMPNGQQQEPGGWNRVVLRVNRCVEEGRPSFSERDGDG